MDGLRRTPQKSPERSTLSPSGFRLTLFQRRSQQPAFLGTPGAGGAVALGGWGATRGERAPTVRLFGTRGWASSNLK